ncbi:DUF5050 domain-containing protein [Tissierella pigra]|uniref:DUF5050 domain-containing protein n=1 Tax=Tissierella pigra TaxID=2607614 RepID=A0A6N7XMH0_9FIRM|nr:DUF5050 domain-containing protein [Tissierella pigra]MSU03291.1 DUF5050 domain-containing protein [Tissierella pigra]
MNRAITLFIIIVSTLLSGCGKSDEMNENSRVFNMQINRIFSENQDAVFYIQGRNKIIAQDKESGSRYDAVKNPFASFFDVGTVFYIYDNNLYYIRNKETYTQAGALQESTSIVEIDWDTYDERIIYELDTRIKKEAFLGTIKSDSRSFSRIISFFLDNKYIYLVEGTTSGSKINKVDRQTRKAETILEFPRNIEQIAFDGKYIYYVNLRFQVVRLDVETKENFIIPDVVTRNMMLKDNQLLFLNPRDNGRIYAMDLNDFSLRKITEDAAYTFHYDDRYIYYSNEDDNKYLYRIDFKAKSNQKVAEVVSNRIAVFQNHKELHVLSDKGTFVVDKEIFEVNILE